ncbi:MAG TPA: type IV pilin N-terminal domain-containing protein [Candidatus Thermoplasmatota archaeon]|nr:type IV pilin N-terminal domain-containing protein [Candidatus Thermoplasmatota archaeon]
MKANQAFKANEEAVSPVIGVILMVAITVVLAAVVFVLVTRLAGNSNDAAPQISFSKQSGGAGGAIFTVTQASSDAGTWAAYELLVNGAPSVMTQHSATNANGCYVVSAPGDNVQAGNRISCVGNTMATVDPPARGTQIQLRHIPTNTLMTVGTI